MTQRRNQRRDLCRRETQNIPCSLMSFNSCFSVVLCSSVHASHAFLRSRNDPTVGKDDMTKRAEIKVVSYLADHSVSLYCFNHYRYVQRCCARFLKIIQRMALKKTKKATCFTKNANYRTEMKDLQNNTFSLIFDETSDIRTLNTCYGM